MEKIPKGFEMMCDDEGEDLQLMLPKSIYDKRVEFYQSYRNNREIFVLDFPKESELWSRETNHFIAFEDWLFDKVFSGEFDDKIVG